MASQGMTVATEVRRNPRRAEHLFFSLYSLALAGMVFFGFAKSYFLAGLVFAPLPNALIHVHGAAFTCWIGLLLAQNWLAMTGRIGGHKQLGVFGFLLAVAMVVLGTLAARDLLAGQRTPEGLLPIAFFFATVGYIWFFFVPFVLLAFLYRRTPQTHKHLILLATLAISEAGVQRWPIAAIAETTMGLRLVMDGMLLVLVAWDLITAKKVHPVTLWGGLWFAVVRECLLPLGMTPAWAAICIWARSHGIISY